MQINSAADAIDKLIEKRLNDYESEKQSVERFKRSLAELVKDDAKPLVIFVDELDRCRPDFAVKTIERIKHFFEVPKVVFVLAVNGRQLAQSIRGVYGPGIDAENYMGKFIQFSLGLPKIRSNGYGEDHNQVFCRQTLTRYGMGGDKHDDFAAGFSMFANAFDFSLRHIEKAVILYSIAQPVFNSYHIAWAIALKLQNEEIFYEILLGKLAAHTRAATLLTQVLPETRCIDLANNFIKLHEFLASGEVGEPDKELVQWLGFRRAGSHVGKYVEHLFGQVDLAVRT